MKGTWTYYDGPDVHGTTPERRAVLRELAERLSARWEDSEETHWIDVASPRVVLALMNEIDHFTGWGTPEEWNEDRKSYEKARRQFANAAEMLEEPRQIGKLGT